MSERSLDTVIRLVGLCIALLALTACDGSVPLSGPSNDTVERGEAGAINPARNVHVVCADKNQNAGVTVNITNNCNKNNSTAEPFVVEE